MLEYDRKYISKGIDINKTNASKECDICHYWYFLDKQFKSETYLVAISCCNDVAIVSIKQSDCTIYLWYMSNDDTINIRKNSNLNGKRGLLQIFYDIQEWVIKLLITENREIILNKAKECYENNKERLMGQARNKYGELFEKEKDIKREYGRNR